MTRENKLALVVGFGLILLVGVLISDHFSTARSQQAADLRGPSGTRLADGRPVDPLVHSRRSDPQLIDLRPREQREAARNRGQSAGPLAMNTTQIPAEEPPAEGAAPAAEEAASNGVRRIVMGEPAPVPRSERAQRSERDDDVQVTFHNVRPGETLTAIARRYYGDGRLVKQLAAFNGLSDADALRVDHRLRIPPASALGGEGAAQASSSERRSEPQEVYTTYTVKRGDTLSELSLELLGTSRRWRELYELNRDVIRDPDNLHAGTVLKVPRPG